MNLRFFRPNVSSVDLKCYHIDLNQNTSPFHLYSKGAYFVVLQSLLVLLCVNWITKKTSITKKTIALHIEIIGVYIFLMWKYYKIRLFLLYPLCFVLHRILLIGCNFWVSNNEGSPCPTTPATITPTRARMHASVHPSRVACCKGGAN